MKLRFSYHDKLAPLHIIGKTKDQGWPTTMPIAWSLFQDAIADLEETYGVTTHAFVLMRNHYHWLCTYNIQDDPHLFQWFHELLNTQFLFYLERNAEDVYTLNYEPKVISIENFPSYKATYYYVYNNPVSAGLTHWAQDYPYSTLWYALNGKPLEFHIIDNMNLITDSIRTIHWLNDVDNFDFS